MLSNYLKVAFRRLRREPAYAVISATGLAVSLAAAGDPRTREPGCVPRLALRSISPHVSRAFRGTEAEKLARQFPDFVDQHAFTHEKGGCEEPSARITLQLQRLTNIHLYSDFANPARFAGPRQYIYIFSAAALFLLLIGSINYVNLATALAMHRTREVGVAITVEELTT